MQKWQPSETASDADWGPFEARAPDPLVVKGLDRLENTLESLRDEYRKGNSLDERKESELDAQI